MPIEPRRRQLKTDNSIGQYIQLFRYTYIDQCKGMLHLDSSSFSEKISSGQSKKERKKKEFIHAMAKLLKSISSRSIYRRLIAPAFYRYGKKNQRQLDDGHKKPLLWNDMAPLPTIYPSPFLHIQFNMRLERKIVFLLLPPLCVCVYVLFIYIHIVLYINDDVCVCVYR